MSKLKRNLAANYLGRAWSGLSVYIFLPLYIGFLGVEAYGIVAFYSVLLRVFAFTNSGVTATLSREMARLSTEPGSGRSMGSLLRTLETVFFGLAAGAGLFVVLLAPTIAESWVNASKVPISSVTWAVALMGVSMALQFPNSLYQGGLQGLERQVLSNVLLMGFVTIRGGGAVLVLWLYSATVEAFFVWQTLVNGLQASVSGIVLWGSITVARRETRFSFKRFKSVWRYAAGMTGISVISVFLSQIDKLAASSLLSLEVFGFYAVAVAVSQLPTMLSSPVSIAVFPRFAKLVHAGKAWELRQLYHKCSQLVSAIVLPTALVLSFFSMPLITLWTRDRVIGSESGPLAAVLVAGSAALALQVVPFSLALANGWTRLNLIMGAIAILFVVPMTLVLVNLFGAMGAAASWLVLNLFHLPVFVFFLHRRHLPGEVWSWCLSALALPLTAASAPVLLIYWIVPADLSGLPLLVAVALSWTASAAAVLVVAPALRPDIAGFLRQGMTRLRKA